MNKLLPLKSWRYCAKIQKRGRLAFLSFSLCFLGLMYCYKSSAQSLRDNIWIIGNFGQGTTLDFSNDTLAISLNNTQMTHLSANASICDTLGNLQFYTNGVYIASANHQQMWNGNGLDLGLLNGYPQYGSNAPQILIALPMPNNQNIYYLLYKAVIQLSPEELSSKFYYSIIEMSKNNGKGMVVDKNHLVLEGVYLDWGEMTACKHANGRDWWILLGESDTNRYFKYLLTPQGLIEQPIQEIGHNVPSGLGQAVFSPNGEKYVRVNLISTEVGNYIDIYDFDRCNGLLSNHLQINYIDSAGAGGAAISNNSRFLYVPSQSYVYQFDLFASSVEESKKIVAVYDGFESPFWTTFYQAQLAPDKKIYICASNGANVLHVINSPDEEGLACNLIQHGIQLPTSNAVSMPNFPNFNLGALQGSPCDTLGVSAVHIENKPQAIAISPNPAQSHFEIKVPDESMQAMLTLRSATGQPVLKQRLMAGWSVVGLEGISPGMYFWEVQDAERVLGTGKLVRVE